MLHLQLYKRSTELTQCFEYSTNSIDALVPTDAYSQAIGPICRDCEILSHRKLAVSSLAMTVFDWQSRCTEQMLKILDSTAEMIFKSEISPFDLPHTTACQSLMVIIIDPSPFSTATYLTKLANFYVLTIFSTPVQIEWPHRKFVMWFVSFPEN